MLLLRQTDETLQKNQGSLLMRLREVIKIANNSQKFDKISKITIVKAMQRISIDKTVKSVNKTPFSTPWGLFLIQLNDRTT